MPFLAYQLKPEEYPGVKHWMLNPGYNSRSFTERMAEMIPRQPDAYILTAYSAVPIADSIRGYYDTIGQPVPELHYVHANTANSRDKLQRKAAVAEEIVRLQPLFSSVESVCVVNQYRCTGGSVQMAATIARKIGVSTIHVMEGQWYHDADNEDVDLKHMTSTHAELMYEIGACAGKAALLAS